VETNQLKYLSTVAERGSFSKAALHCFISQSALSDQIQKLEEEVGATLLNRSRRIIVPTEAGRIFITHAGQVLAQLARATREIQGLNVINAGRVVLGVLPTIAPYLLPQILESFAARCSNVELNIHEDMTVALLRLIEAGAVDFGIMSLPIDERGFEIKELFSEDLLVALPSKHPLAGKSQIHVKDLRSEQFILMHEGHYLGDQLLGCCQRHDFQPRILIRSGQLETIQSLVGAGMGISLIPRMAMLNTGERVLYRPLKNHKPRRTIAIIWCKRCPLKKVAQEFLKHLCEVGKTFQLPSTNHHSFRLPEKPKA
jgi:LysR family hydrogen peroxide-inducible transcriptional activator